MMPKLSERFTITTPTPKQAAFHLLEDKQEVLYGGAAGGGKSEALLQAASRYVDYPNYHALLLRRTFKNLSLPGALMDRSHQWWNKTAARWNGDKHQWVFPSGAIVQFGYMEKENDHLQYQSSDYNFIGFDELTQFNQRHYTYMFSRLRRLEGSNIPARMRAATNPGGPGHEWVKNRFNLPDGPTQEWWDSIRDPEDIIIDKCPRGFVPARLEDNPYLDIGEYEKAFAELSDVTRRQLRLGDWNAGFGGGKFYPHGNIQIFQHGLFQPQDFASIIRFWDLASSDPTENDPDPDWTVGIKVGRTIYGKDEWDRPDYVILDVARMRGSSEKVEAFVSTVANRDGRSIPQWFEQERGGAGKLLIGSYRQNLLPLHEVHGLPPEGNKETRAQLVQPIINEGRRFYALEADWNEAFFDELVVFNQGSHDDQVDALSGAYIALTKQQYANTVGARVREY